MAGTHLPAEEFERPRLKACIMDTRQAMRKRILNRQNETFLKLFVGGLRTLGVGKFLSVVEKYA